MLSIFDMLICDLYIMSVQTYKLLVEIFAFLKVNCYCNKCTTLGTDTMHAFWGGHMQTLCAFSILL